MHYQVAECRVCGKPRTTVVKFAIERCIVCLYRSQHWPRHGRFGVVVRRVFRLAQAGWLLILQAVAACGTVLWLGR